MAIETALTRRLGLSVPVILAPMALVSGGALAAAVSRGGGLGLIGGGYAEGDWLSEQIAHAGNAEIGIGFITWALARNPDLLAVALDRRPRAIFLSFGDLRPFAPAIARAGIPLICQVQTLHDAEIALGEGASVLVAQGTEAGGHGGGRSTMALVPEIADMAGDVPVAAAGGIVDGRGLAASLMLGAGGAVCGTAFFASRESLSHAKAKERAVAASGDETVRDALFDLVRGRDWPTRWTNRTLRNDYHRGWSTRLHTLREQMTEQRPRYFAAQEAGDMDVAATIVGEGVGLVRDIEPAGTILDRMVAEAEARLRNGGGDFIGNG
ncbi:NAD(P)H-dependent flavin oxidoreductase [Enterovirga rhinocerotis]|uniref:Nitronate monooxygenase n=1 Tax=Enterovirga rhinocerotis TaxID=1339210 RepID=A0A4R7BQW3_9HYPH|nr:nitronate monooxygenase [Enterovirga rhinocerotis]TDR88064.1 nitronate monooxygenase [Enterovirga rhinocerotis]